MRSYVFHTPVGTVAVYSDLIGLPENGQDSVIDGLGRGKAGVSYRIVVDVFLAEFFRQLAANGIDLSYCRTFGAIFIHFFVE